MLWNLKVYSEPFILYYTKFCWYVLYFEWVFYSCIILCHHAFGHLESIGSLSYVDLVKMLIFFIIQCRILHLLISPPILSDKTSLIFA